MLYTQLYCPVTCKDTLCFQLMPSLPFPSRPSLSPANSAVLENHHVAQSFRLTQENQQANIFQALDL